MSTTAADTVNLGETRDAWSAIAEGYDKFVTPTHMWLGNEALMRAGLKAGTRFLDVAAGSGALSIPAARLGASVLSTDLSPAMVDRVDARARAEGIVNLEARVMDGHHLALEDDSFDMAGSQFGVMLFPDMPKALSELARVTRPGGRVVLVVYGPPAQIDFLSFFIGAIQTVIPGFPGLPMNPPPFEFQAADAKVLRTRLIDAGLHDVSVETLTESMQFESGDELWNWVTSSNPIGARLVADLTEEQAADVRAALGESLSARASDGVAVLMSPIHVGIGTA